MKGACVPSLSVVIPTFNNEAILRRAVGSWREAADAHDVEVIVVEDGCGDGTRRFLDEESATPWGARHLRWLHTDDVHELRCTNAGFAAARAPLLAAWQDDMFLRSRWLVPELLRTFRAYAEIGLLSLSRGLDHHPSTGEIRSWDDLVDERRLRSTIGPSLYNWLRLQEVDGVIRPWVVRRQCLQHVGPLDEAFVPTEWDEADLACRIRAAGWKVATCGYERLEGYTHLGSSTLGALTEAYKAGVLRNGRLFHERWDGAIARDHARTRRTWRRRPTAGGWLNTGRQAARAALARGLGVR
ncbi:MAG TPA: glycosyltransferase [Vicinamibacterales bacterium]|nr:glycosyltransferase [Vicinamibacterales bacterium]